MENKKSFSIHHKNINNKIKCDVFLRILLNLSVGIINVMAFLKHFRTSDKFLLIFRIGTATDMLLKHNNLKVYIHFVAIFELVDDVYD